MKRDYLQGAPAEADTKKEGGQTTLDKPQVSDTLAKLDEATKAKKKLNPPKCCGRLPCKGRTLNCYTCLECLDCITGAGCGHNSSTHDPSAHQITNEEPDNAG